MSGSRVKTPLLMTKELKKQLDESPLTDLKHYLRDRTKVLRSKYGLWGESKSVQKCPHCKKLVGVRELRRHKRRIDSECPARKIQ